MSYKAFVSSTYKDLLEHRAYVIKALREAGVTVDPMEDWPPDSDEPMVFSQERVEGCDLCVLLVGFRRGYVPGGETRSITQMEYDAAVKLGIDILVFMLDEKTPWVRDFDELDKDPEMRPWRKSLERRGPGMFGQDPTTIKISPAIARWIAKRGAKAGAAPPAVVERISNIPHMRNPAFVGREALLGQPAREGGKPGELRAYLEADRRVVLSGLPGIGKTQITVEYAYRYADDYDVVWWLRAEDAKTLTEDMAALAARLAPEVRAEGVAERVEVARERLGQRGDWLLVFDNATDAAAVAGVLPRANTGHVLISSWNPSWRALGARVIEIPKLDRTASIAFLKQRSNDDDTVAADELADELGDLPLALDHAAAFVEVAGSSLHEYLELYRERGPELRAKHVDTTASDTVAATWEISIRSAGQQSRTAAALLDYVAFVAPDAFPLAVFDRAVDDLPDDLRVLTRDRLARLEALAVVRRYSLARVENELLSVHRLVQAVMRDRMDPARRRDLMMLVVGSLSKAFPTEADAGDDVGPAILLPHLVAALEHVVHGEITQEGADLVAEQQGIRSTATQPEYTSAQPVGKHAERSSVSDTTNHVLSDPAGALNVGTSLREHGAPGRVRSAGAPPAGPAARGGGPADGERQVQPLAAEHKAISEMLSRVSNVVSALDQYDRAGLAFNRAVMPDDETMRGNASASVDKLGTIVRAHGDLAAAKQAYEYAFDLLRRRLGEDHPSTASVEKGLRALGASP